MVSLTRPEGSEPEDFHATRRNLGAMFFAGYALAGLPANGQTPEKAIRTPEAWLTTATFNIPTRDAKSMPVYAAYPAARGRYPVILVISEVFGVHEYIRDICRRLARAGYFAVAPAFFFRSGTDPASLTDNAQIQRIAVAATNEQVIDDISATLFWAKQQPSADARNIGITGFCWGGATVWMAVQRFPDFKAGVAWYGRLKKPPAGNPFGAEVRPWPLDIAAGLRVPVLGLYAGQDAGIPVADVEEMRAALIANKKRGSEIILYDKAQHGFHADYRPQYDQAAATDGWARMLAHFAKNGLRGRIPRELAASAKG